MSDSPSRARPSLQENELAAYARLIWRWLWLIVLCAVAGGISAYVASILSTPIYQATATVLINEARNSASSSYQDILTSERLARTYAELMTQRPIQEEVAAQLGLDLAVFDAASAAITDVEVTPVRDTQLVRIQVEGVAPELVMAVANALPSVFAAQIERLQSARFANSKENLQEQLALIEQQITDTKTEIDALGQPQSAEENLTLGRLENLLSQYQNSYAGLLQNYETLRLIEAQSVDSISVVEPAVLPDGYIRPRTLVNTLLAAIVGAMLAVGVVFLFEYLDDRIRSPEELSELVDAPLFGVISRFPDVNETEYDGKHLIALQQPRHPIAESFRSLRTNLQFSSVDTGLHSVVLTSALPGEGKTTVSANLAVVMAQAGLRVVLVDADLRRPVQHKIYGLRRRPGLSDLLLTEGASLDHYLQPSPLPNLHVLTAGQDVPNPAELLGSQRMQQVIQLLRNEADLLIFDAPPVLAVTDAQVLGRLAQGVLLVVDADQATRNTVIRAAGALRQVNVPLFGAVVNRLTSSSRGYYYYYGSYDRYYVKDGDEESDGSGSRSGKTAKRGRGSRKPDSALVVD